jgi:ADP-L-glycero-D-manno-heptose 6-epimerase
MKQKRIFDDQLIVITGGAGFIGSCVIRYLNDKGLSNLLIVDDLNDSNKWRNLVGKSFADIIPKSEIFNFLKGREREIEAFVHLGACSSTTETDADYLLNNNYRFSVKLAEYALKYEQRFIYASSAATYGNGEQGFSDNEKDLKSLRPLNMYGYSKHLFDLWAQKEKVLDQIVGLKYFNVFGPNEYHKKDMASMIYKMFAVANSGKPIKLYKSNDPKYKDGEQLRDFIYVKDAVKMTCELLTDAFKDVSGIFNIGSGKPITWNTIANALFAALGKPAKIEYIDMPDNLDDQYQNYTCADMTKYNKIHGLDSTKCMSIEDAVKDYVQNYLMKNWTW